MVFTDALSLEANLAIFYGCLLGGVALLGSGLRNKTHGQYGLVFLTLVAAFVNYQYGVHKSAGELLAFFNTIYDPVHNIGMGSKSVDDFPGLALCEDGRNNCTLLPDLFPVHAAWSTTLYRRFADGAEAARNCTKLYAHIWCNTTAFLICLVQMHQPTRKKYLELHRKMGWAAVVLITCGTCNALWLATDHGREEYYGGNLAVAGWFLSVGGTIFGTLVPGILAVLRKDIPSHKKWMTRFYGAMWGAYLIFRLEFFVLGYFFCWHKNATILINIWTCTPMGALLAEGVRTGKLGSYAGSEKLATDTKSTVSRRGTMETVDSFVSVKKD